MKRILSLLLVLCIVLLSFAACGNKGGDETPDGGASTQTPGDGGSTPPTEEQKEPTSEEKYNSAFALIAEGKYAEAYALLKALGDYKDAKTQLGYFITLPSTLSYGYYGDPGTDCAYEYDANGRLVKIECAQVIDDDDEVVLTVTFTYDEDGNLTAFNRDFSYDVDTSRTWEYDEDGNCIREVYTADGTSVYEYTYNEDGLLTKTEQTTTYPGYISEMTYTYTYDANGNLTLTVCERSDNNGPVYTERQTVEYDANGNAVRSVYIDKDGDQMVGVATYDANGNMLTYEYTYSDGEKENSYYTYDANGRMITERHVSEWGEDTTVYTYDANGNCTGKVMESTYGTEEYEYTYNADGKLVKEVRSYDGEEAETIEFTYTELLYVPYEFPEYVQSVLDDWQALFYDID